MIPGTILTRLKALFSGNWRALLAVLFLLPATYLLGQCSGIKTGRAQMQHAIDAANVKAIEQKSRADTLAANQRITDTIAVSRQEREVIDAVASTPDSLPDASRRALGCDRLRRAHSRDPANIPPGCRLNGGVQAGAAP